MGNFRSPIDSIASTRYGCVCVCLWCLMCIAPIKIYYGCIIATTNKWLTVCEWTKIKLDIIDGCFNRVSAATQSNEQADSGEGEKERGRQTKIDNRQAKRQTHKRSSQSKSKTNHVTTIAEECKKILHSRKRKMIQITLESLFVQIIQGG